jgi:hypothetical protein
MDRPTEPREQLEMGAIAKRGTGREGAQPDLNADHRADPTEGREADGRGEPALDPTDLRTGEPDCPRDVGLTQADLDPGGAQLLGRGRQVGLRACGRDLRPMGPSRHGGRMADDAHPPLHGGRQPARRCRRSGRRSTRANAVTPANAVTRSEPPVDAVTCT